MLDWEQIRSDFEWNGTYPDIVVLESSKADYQTMLDIIRERYPKHFFYDQGWGIGYEGTDFVELPERAEEVFARIEETGGALLRIDVEGVQIHCSFWGDEIEVYFDPRQVKGEREANGLADFMSCLGRRLGKEVVLRDEFLQDYVMLRYRPDVDEVVWVPRSDPCRPVQPSTWYDVFQKGTARVLRALGWKGRKELPPGHP